MDSLIKGNILIVDDEPILQELWKEEFEYLGYKVFTACSGNDGVQLLKEYKIDLVITDLKMPGSDGFTILEFFKKNNGPKIPVFLCTGFIENDSEILKKYDMIKIILKPFSLVNEMKTIQKYLK